MAGRSLTAYSKVLSFGVVDSEQEVAARLSLAANTRLLKLERLRLAADEPFAVETCYLPADEFTGLTRSLIARGSLFSLLEGTYGIQIAYADEEMDATAAAPATANLLKVARDEPLLRIRQVIYSTTGKASLYMLGLYRSDRHTLLVRRYR
jgi:GntR family transcriptional regulator